MDIKDSAALVSSEGRRVIELLEDQAGQLDENLEVVQDLKEALDNAAIAYSELGIWAAE